jgi:hypothetical protein
MAELSNMLHHLYRLRELCKTRLAGFEQQIEPQTPALKWFCSSLYDGGARGRPGPASGRGRRPGPVAGGRPALTFPG